MEGHGDQKLFGSFGGPGLQRTGGLMEMLGFLNPVGPIGIIGSMGIATTKAHRGKPIWVTEGGAEFPVTNIAAATALMVGGPGRWSLDRAFGVRLLAWIAPLGLVDVVLTLIYAGVGAPEPEQDEAREGTAGNDDA